MNSITKPAGEPTGNRELVPVITELSQVAKALFKEADIFGDVAFLSQGLCPDSTTNFVVLDKYGKQFAVILLSPSIEPDQVQRTLAKSEYLKGILGIPLGNVIPSPLLQGEVAGRSFGILPYYSALRTNRLLSKYDNLRIRPYIYRWLLEVMHKTLTRPTNEEIETHFRTPLNHLLSLDLMAEPVKEAANKGLKRLELGDWIPQLSLMHGDLWRGNMMILNRHINSGLSGKRPESFVIIDWAGAQQKGYGIYDMVRISESLDTFPSTLGKEVKAACHTLQCHLTDARAYLAAALGHLGMNLGHFPVERYLELSNRCMEKLILAT